MKKKTSVRRFPFPLVTGSLGILVSGFAAISARGQTADIWNSNTGDQTTAVNGNFSTGPWSGSTPPIATSAVQINSVLAGAGNQTVTYDTVAGSTIYSLNISEDVGGVSNLLVETAAFGANNNNLLALGVSSGNALTISATGAGTGAVAGLSFSGASSNTGTQAVLALSGTSSAITLNATMGNTAEILINSSTTLAAGLTAISLGGTSAATAGTLTIGNGGAGTSLVALTGNNSAATSAVYTYITSASSGGTVAVNSNGRLVVGSTGFTNTTAAQTQNGNINAKVNLAGGTLQIANQSTATTATANNASLEYVNVAGNLTTTAGSVIQLDAGTLADGTTINTNSRTLLNLNGATNSLTSTTISVGQALAGNNTGSTIGLGGATTTLSGITFRTAGAASSSASQTTYGANILFGGGAQTLTSDTPLYGILVRGSVAGSTQVAGSTKTLTITTNPASGNVGTINFGVFSGTPSQVATLQLGSDLRLYASASMPGTVATNAGLDVIDLNGKTFDTTLLGTTGTRPSTNGTYVPNAGNSATASTLINSSVAGGTFRAVAFNLTNNSTGTISVGPNAVLQATTSGTTNGADITNNLSGITTGAGATLGTFDPTSTFYYTGADGTAFPTSGLSLLTVGSRTAPIGGITVGDPSATTISSLRLASAVTVGGNVQTNTNASGGLHVLNLGGNTLTLAGTAKLTGTGIVTGNSGAASTLNWAAGATGGISPGTTGTVGILTVTTNSVGFNLDMTNAGTSQFDIASTSSFDQVTKGTAAQGTGAVTSLIYGGVLSINLLGPVPAGTSTYQLFNERTGTGTFSSIVVSGSNAASITSDSFDITTGTLTIVTAVPEPSTTGLLGGTVLLGLVARAYLRRRSAA